MTTRDSELTGDELLRRIDALTNASLRDPSGGNGWRHLLYAAAREIRLLTQANQEMLNDIARLLDDMGDDDYEDC